MKSIDAIPMRPVDNMVRQLLAHKLPECSLDDGKTWVVDKVAIAEMHADVAALLISLAEALEPFSVIGDVFTKQSMNDDSPWVTIPDDQKLNLGVSHLHVTVGDLRRATVAIWGKK